MNMQSGNARLETSTSRVEQTTSAFEDLRKPPARPLLRGYTVSKTSDGIPFRSLHRFNCTVIRALTKDTSLGTHLTRRYNETQEAIIRAELGSQDSGFAVILTSEPESQLKAIGEALTAASGGRKPDIVSIPDSRTLDRKLLPPDREPMRNQLLDEVRMIDGRSTHIISVVGTDYLREGTLEELAASQPVVKVIK